MKSLFDEKVEYKTSSIDTPIEILDFQCKELSRLTSNGILSKVTEYTGPTSSYIKRFFSGFDILSDKEVNIQESLGELLESSFSYEFFISSTATPNYKYHVLFMILGLSYYPVNLVLDEDIAAEVIPQKDDKSPILYNYTCNTQEEYEDLLGKILNSNKFISAINGLLTHVNKKENNF